MRRESGFTLIELLVVLAIISILAGMSVMNYHAVIRLAYRAAAQQALADATTAAHVILSDYDDDGVATVQTTPKIVSNGAVAQGLTAAVQIPVGDNIARKFIKKTKFTTNTVPLTAKLSVNPGGTGCFGNDNLIYIAVNVCFGTNDLLSFVRQIICTNAEGETQQYSTIDMEIKSSEHC